MSTYLRERQLASTPTRPGRLPISAATLWRWAAAGKFPAPVRLSEGVTAWRISDIEAWEAKHRGVTA